MLMLIRIFLRVFLLFVAVGLGAARVAAAEHSLTVSLGGEPRRFTAAELLARPDAASLAVPDDVSYHRSMTYRAVPLLDLIKDAASGDLDTIEARASDGFVSLVPAALVKKGASGGAVAWIAVEDPAAPWPTLPGKETGAGPFYLVWTHPERSNIGAEQWPYALEALTGVDDPLHRWPQLALDSALPAGAPERRGQAAFIKNCMPCHTLNGAGNAEVGPDLGRPLNVTKYMTPFGIKAVIRDPKAVRTWPQQQMTGFDKASLPDAEVEAIIAFLTHMASR